MMLLIWAIPYLILAFAWDLNEANRGRMKQRTRSLLALLSLMVCGLVGFEFGPFAGFAAVSLLVFLAALFHYPAALIAEWVDRHSDYGRRGSRRHAKHRHQS
jgi:hypothetical protein